MPYVDLRLSEVQLYWTSNIPGHDLHRLRTHPKPLVLLLHPVMLSSDWREPQLTDPYLHEAYYMIAIDALNNGRSKCTTYLTHDHASRHDSWAEAAMLALFAQALHLPPFHIFAEHVVACDIANKFAILFPQQYLSLTLIGIFPPIDELWFHEAHEEGAMTWASATDLDTLEEAHNAFAWLYFFTDRDYNALDEDEMDRFMEHLRVRHGPGDKTNGLLVAAITARYRLSPSPEEFARIKQPVLIMQGTNSSIPMLMSAAEKHAPFYVNSKFQLEWINGAPLLFASTDRWASHVNIRFASFLDAQPFDRARVCSVDNAALRNALNLVASFESNPSIARKDPMAMWSYSRTAPDVAEGIRNLLVPALTLQGKPPIVPEGVRIRKYSERNDEAWLPRRGQQSDEQRVVFFMTTSQQH